MKYDSAKLLLAVDLIGTFVFAVEGATAAIQGELDLLGLMVLSFATALAGGIIRDLLIGAIPPGAIRDWRYPAVAFLAGATVFLWHNYVSRVPQSFLVVVDAAGIIAVRCRRSSQGAGLRNPSIPGGVDGRNHRCRRWHRPRSIAGPRAHCLAVRHLRRGGAGRSSGHGRRSQCWIRAYRNDHCRRDHVFPAADRRCLAALEPAPSDPFLTSKATPSIRYGRSIPSR